MEDKERFRRIEDAILMMKDLIVNHDERLDNHSQMMEKERREREDSRKDFDFKLNALIDAQIQNEIGIRELKEASQLHLQRIEKLENN